MRIAILSFSRTGMELGARLEAALTDRNLAGLNPADEGNIVTVERCGKGQLFAWTDLHFGTSDALVFIGATGIAVRAIAPHVKAKTTDPAVVVVDERATFAISLLSGHIGGANALAECIAGICGATPVITTATDRNGIFAVDTWAISQGMAIVNPERIVDVSSALLAGGRVHLVNEFCTLGSLPAGFDFHATRPTVQISFHRRMVDPTALQLVPPVLAVGIGCRKKTSGELIDATFDAALEEADIRPEAVYAAASIDVKAQEPGLVAWCKHHGLPFTTYSADQLASVKGAFTSSSFVKQTVGVDNVCERAAAAVSGGKVVAPKFSRDGVTIALAQKPYAVIFFKPSKEEQ